VTNGNAIESMLFPSYSKPFDLIYADWIVKWWKWILSIPKEKNPAFDNTGKHADEGQCDPKVMFLSGTFGGPVTRRCKVPSGKSILMPIINYECSFADEPSISSAAALELKCKDEIDDIKNLSFSIDQMNLTDFTPYRVQSPLFEIHLEENNILDVEKQTTKMISDGYWAFLRPLKIGQHRLTSFGSCQSGKIMIAITYDLCVE
jgi:hypothetical protein